MTCQPCPVGSYQNGSAAMRCLPCPQGQSTDFAGAHDFTMCKCEFHEQPNNEQLNQFYHHRCHPHGPAHSSGFAVVLTHTSVLGCLRPVVSAVVVTVF